MLGISHLPITKSPFLRTRSWDLFRQAGDSETKIEQRIKDTAFAGVQGFSLFAELNCGVRDTSKREVLQKGVHHALYSLKFEEVRSLMAGSWEVLGRSECPVWIPDSKMEKLPESAGHRIIHACKSLRWTLGLSEIDTCMGCSKRQRCPMYKKTLDQVDKPFVGLVLFGFFQYARLHLSRPRELPLGLGPPVWEAYAQVLQGLGDFLKDKDGPTGIPLAEGETRTQALEAEAQRKVQARRERAEQVTLNMPNWLRKTLRPLKSPGLTARQRKLVDGIPRNDESADSPEALESDWVEETEAARFSQLMEAVPQTPKPTVAPGKPQDLKVVRRHADGLDPLEDLPAMPRFETRDFRLSPQERQNLQDVGRYSAAKTTKLVVLQGSPSAEGGHLKRQNPQDPVGPLASSGFSLFTQPAPQVIQKNLLNVEDHPVKLPRALPFDANKPVSSTRPKTFKSAPRLLEPRLDVRPLSESSLDQPHLLNESIGFTPGSQTGARKESPFQRPPDSQFVETPLPKPPSVGKPRVVFPKFPLADFEVREDFQTPITGRPVLGQLDHLFRKKPTRD